MNLVSMAQDLRMSPLTKTVTFMQAVSILTRTTIFFIVKFNPQGTLTWQKSISGETVKSLHNITVANNVIYAQVVRGSDPFAWLLGHLINRCL